MSVVVPPGVSGGQSMAVEVNGQQMVVTVPPGLHTGQQFQFAVAAPPMAAAVPMSGYPQPQPMGSPVGGNAPPPAFNFDPQTGAPIGGGGMAAAPVAGVVVSGTAQPQGAQGPPPGVVPNGRYVHEHWCGPSTTVAAAMLAIFFLPALCCLPACKCDTREVYIAPSGQKFLRDGSPAQPDCCECCCD